MAWLHLGRDWLRPHLLAHHDATWYHDAQPIAESTHTQKITPLLIFLALGICQLRTSKRDERKLPRLSSGEVSIFKHKRIASAHKTYGEVFYCLRSILLLFIVH